MSVKEAQEKIDSKEFAEWKQFDQMEPGEPEHSRWLTALLAYTVARPNAGPDCKVSDFLLTFKEPEKPESEEEIRSRHVELLRSKISAILNTSKAMKT